MSQEKKETKTCTSTQNVNIRCARFLRNILQLTKMTMLTAVQLHYINGNIFVQLLNFNTWKIKALCWKLTLLRY